MSTELGNNRQASAPYFDVSFGDLVGALYRRWRTIALTMAVIIIPSLLYGLVREPSYTATALMVVEPPVKAGKGNETAPSSDAEAGAFINTQVNFLLSAPMLNTAMEAMGLYEDSEFKQSFNPLRWLRDLVKPIPDGVDPEALAIDIARRVALSSFQERLFVRNRENSQVIEIAFTSRSASRSAEVANRLAALYSENRLSRMNDEILRWQERTSKQAMAQKSAVIAAENRVAELRSKNQFVQGGNAVLTGTELEELNKLLIQATADESRVRTKLEVIDKLIAAGGTADSINEVLSSQTITQLRMQELDLSRQLSEIGSAYSEDNPRVVAIKKNLANVLGRIGEEVARIVSGLRGDLDWMSGQSLALRERLEAAKSQNASDNMAAVTLQEAEREAVAKRTVYEDLLRSQQQANAAVGTADPGSWVMSPALVPIRPASLGVVSIAAVSLVLSALLGLVLAILRDRLDLRLQDAGHIERSLGVACVSQLPRRGLGTSQPGYSPLIRSAGSAYAQSIQGLGAQLTAATPEAKVWMVTAPHEAGAITATALDLAAFEALGGRRVVLADFNKYHPVVVRGTQMVVREKAKAVKGRGKSKIIARPELPVVFDDATQLHILPLGETQPKAVVASSTRASEALLGRLRAAYDLVIVSAPPILEVSDGHLLAGLADHILLVLQAGETSRDTGNAAVQTLQRLSPAPISAVASTQPAGNYAA